MSVQVLHVCMPHAFLSIQICVLQTIYAKKKKMFLLYSLSLFSPTSENVHKRLTRQSIKIRTSALNERPYLIRFFRPLFPDPDLYILQYPPQNLWAECDRTNNALNDLADVIFYRFKAMVDKTLLRLSMQAVAPTKMIKQYF